MLWCFAIAVSAKQRWANWVECGATMKQWKYSAAWLASASLIRSWPNAYLSEDRLVKPGTMMEGASFIVFGAPHARVVKSIDMLDMYVEHLSWYERRLAKAAKERHTQRYARKRYGEAVRAVRFQGMTRSRIVAVMPYYAAGGGQGPSSVEMRASYLNATVASLRAALTDRIVVAVQNRKDLESLPRVGHLYLPGFRPEKLGVAALIALHRKLKGQRVSSDWLAKSDLGYVGSDDDWSDVDYVYYTESDQILRLKSLTDVLSVVDDGYVVVPRRAVPLPTSADFALRKDESSDDRAAREALVTSDEFNMNGELASTRMMNASCCSCCFAGDVENACRQVDLQDRATLAGAGHRLLRRDDHGFAVLPGEGNFIKMAFRPCALDCSACDSAQKRIMC